MTGSATSQGLGGARAELPACPPSPRPPALSGSWASTPAVRRVMQANKSGDTRPELAVRRALHAMGLRYRVGARPLADLRRTADLVFRRAQVAVFLDGCFWHGCPDHYAPPKSNRAYWTAKIEANAARDRQTTTALENAGWTVLRFWSHEDPAGIAARVAGRLRQTQPIAARGRAPRPDRHDHAVEGPRPGEAAERRTP